MRVRPRMSSRSRDVGGGDVVSELGSFAEGRAFLAALDAFLDEHGRRTPNFVNISAPSRIEDPAPLIAALNDPVTHPDHDLDAELARLPRTRAPRQRPASSSPASRSPFAASSSSCSTRPAGNGPPGRPQLLARSQVLYEVRLLVLEPGRRLAANRAVESADDVFHLRVEELDGLAAARRRPSRSARRARRVQRDRRTSRHRVASPGPPPDDPSHAR